MVALNIYLNTIGFLTAIIRDLDSQSLTNTTDLKDLEEVDIRAIFKLIRNPGG